ncbi:MAG: hypothetical protein EKK53_06340 [Burkholderiales bacterium]|nr:MAG: hypothetical protein EKK53_06340 [Burkholderiales bacterium]
MNRPLIILINALALGAALPAFAGPDWQAIEQARKAKQATQMARDGNPMPAKGAEAMTCPPDALVLPLDHGPRAQSTPYLNAKRKDRYEAEQKACKEAAAKGAVQ